MAKKAIIKSDKSDTIKRKLVEAMEKSLGVVTNACQMVGCTRDTYYRYMRDDPEFAAKIDNIKDIALDFVESQMFNEIREHRNPTLMIFYLKTKGKERGYIERSEHIIGGTLNLSTKEDIADELRKLGIEDS